MRLARLLVGVISVSLLWTGLAARAGSDDAAKKKDRAQSHLIRAQRFAADYKMDKAAGEARKALEDDPGLAEAHVYLGLQPLHAGDFKEAEPEFRKALDLDPYQAAAHCYLGYVLYQKGQLEDATDQWTLSIRLDSTSPQAYAGLALSQFKHGRKEEAARTYEKALQYDRRFSDPQFLASDKGPNWTGQLLVDAKQLLPLVHVPKFPY